MLTPEQMDDAGELTAAVYRQIEADLLDYLIAKMIEGDVSGQRAQTALALLSQTMPVELKRAIVKHSSEIDAAVKADVERALSASDAWDLAAISEGLGMQLAADALTVQTLSVVASVRGVLARDNVEMSAAARRQYMKWADWAATQVATGNMTADRAKHVAVRKLAREGLSINWIQYKDPDTGERTVRARADVAVQRHIRTLIAQGAAELTMQRCEESGCGFVEVSSHIGARPSHAEWHGRCYHIGGAVEVDGVKYEDFHEGTGYQGLRGPYTALGDQLLGVNCVVEGTEVWGPSPRVVYRREYSGEIVSIRTALGHRLAVTPNHPVLTPQGWIPAHLLREGCHIFSACLGNGSPNGARPNNDERPPRIEQVFDTWRDSVKVRALLGSAGDFHGDGIADREVEVVLVDVPLVDDRQPPLPQHGAEARLHGASRLSDSCLRRGPLDEVGMALPGTPDGIMGWRGEGAALLGGHPGKPRAHCIAPALGGIAPLGEALADDHVPRAHAHGNIVLCDAGFVKPHDLVIVESEAPGVGREAEFAQAVRDDLAADTEFPRYVGGTKSFFVQLDEVVEVNIDSGVTCHVFNLETESGWYFAGNIVTHNCRHSFAPWFPGMPRAYGPDPEHPSGLDNDEVYSLTQKQRAIEREIRADKREIAACTRLFEADPSPENEAALASAKAKLRNRQAKMRDFIRESNAKCKPGTEVLVRQPQREWAGDMP